MPSHHHRRISVITSAANFICPTSPTVIIENDKNNNSSCGSSLSANHYPYLPSHNEVPGDGVDSNSQFGHSADSGACSSDNIESWKWRLTTLLNSKDKHELVSREKKDRRDYERIAALASQLGLHSRLYFKVVVVSKVPLPNYRFDLDDKRPQREVNLPLGLQRRVDAHLATYLSQKTRSMDGSRDTLFSTPVTNGSVSTNEGLVEQREPFQNNKAALDKVLWRKSMQLCMKQQAWQKSSEGQKILEFRISLPAYKEKDSILDSISKNQVKLVAERQHKFPSLF